MNPVRLYDTTLRDGTQGEGISLSLNDKLAIARLLDEFGITYIEGGWPGSNPKDAEFFRRIRESGLRQAIVVAFGSTRRPGLPPDSDTNLQALVDADTPAVTLVGKSSTLHVTEVLRTTLEENLAMIADSVRWMKGRGREVIYDAEHFFDGYRVDPDYALEAVRVAADAGADWIVLCDTNGGSLPSWIRRVVAAVRAEISTRLGVHTHNDSELAVANALAAVEEGCTQVQGTINGYGERCGNANLVSIIPTLQLKMGRGCIPDENLARLTELSRTVAEIANQSPNPYAPYVGYSAFAHKGGIHGAAVEKVNSSYEHIPPESVGNRRRFVVSELSGRANVRVGAAELGLRIKGNEQAVLAQIKELESRGFQFEAAEGSLELLFRRSQPDYTRPFDLLDVMVVATAQDGNGMRSEATVVLRLAEEVLLTSAEATGPVHALDRALREALVPCYPALKEVRLTDYKVRILDPEEATGATTRVLIEAGRGVDRWSTVGCSGNIIEASCQALLDSFELALVRAGLPDREPVAVRKTGAS
jgi:2-isopropylmalate synthase